MAVPKERKPTSRALSQKSAVECCKAGEKAQELNLRASLGSMLAILLDESYDEGILYALAPGAALTGLVEIPKPKWDVIRTSPKFSPNAGAVVLVPILAAAALKQVISSTAARTAALETMTAVLVLVDVITRTKQDTEDECEKCVEKRLWSQSKPLGRRPRGESSRQRGVTATRRPGRPQGSKDSYKRTRRKSA